MHKKDCSLVFRCIFAFKIHYKSMFRGTDVRYCQSVSTGMLDSEEWYVSLSIRK